MTCFHFVPGNGAPGTAFATGTAFAGVARESWALVAWV